MPTAFAMCLNIKVEEIIEKIGQDGSKIIFPNFPDPLCRRGFHHQELIKVCFDQGYLVTLFEVEPILIHNYEYQYLIGNDKEYILTLMENNIGVLCGTVKGTKIPHSVAWDGKYILDPSNDLIYVTDNFNVEMFFLMNRKVKV